MMEQISSLACLTSGPCYQVLEISLSYLPEFLYLGLPAAVSTAFPRQLIAVLQIIVVKTGNIFVYILFCFFSPRILHQCLLLLWRGWLSGAFDTQTATQYVIQIFFSKPTLTKKLVRFYRELAVSDNILVLCYRYITVLLPRVLKLNTIK